MPQSNQSPQILVMVISGMMLPFHKCSLHSAALVSLQLPSLLSYETISKAFLHYKFSWLLVQCVTCYVCTFPQYLIS